MIKNYLRSHIKKITSQNGEEGVVQHILEKIYNNKLSNIDGLELCDIGSGDGFFLSQFYYFIKNFKFKGLLIDGDKNHILESKKLFSNYDTIYHENMFIDKNNNIENFLDKYKFKKDLDLLSIDVDGQDYHIFNSLEKYKPKIIIIESNMTMNSESIIIENEQKNSENYIGIGSSPRAIYELARKKGYKLCLQIFNNLILLDEKYFELLDFEKDYNDQDEIHSAFNLETFQDHKGNVHILSTGPWKFERIINHEDKYTIDTTGGVTKVDKMLDSQKQSRHLNGNASMNFSFQKKYHKSHLKELENFRNFTRDAQQGLNSQFTEPTKVQMDQIELEKFHRNILLNQNDKKKFKFKSFNYIFDKLVFLDIKNKTEFLYEHIENEFIKLKKQKIMYKYKCHNKINYQCLIKIDLNNEELKKHDPIKFSFLDDSNSFEIISATSAQILNSINPLYLHIIDDNRIGDLKLNRVSNFSKTSLNDNFIKKISLYYLNSTSL
tara:strand:+ start:7047 stop:8528 length:1482 start_codon:yes stop_codon:yes gene_type:complete